MSRAEFTQSGPAPIPSRGCGDRVDYLIKVKTGSLPGCGTSARVFIILHGDTDSDRIPLMNETGVGGVLLFNSSRAKIRVFCPVVAVAL